MLHLQRIYEDDYQTKGELDVQRIIDIPDNQNSLGYTDWNVRNFIQANKELLFSCKTLELPWRNNKRDISRIPAGVYEAIKHVSPTFGNSIWIQGVPNRSEILIHYGNYAGSKNSNTGTPDTRGCPLVGEEFYDIDGDGHLDVTNSVRTMRELYDIIPTNKFKIIIEDVK